MAGIFLDVRGKLWLILLMIFAISIVMVTSSNSGYSGLESKFRRLRFKRQSEQTCMDLEFKSCADQDQKIEDCKTSLAQNPSYTPEQICEFQLLNNTEINCYIDYFVDCTERDGLLERCEKKEGNDKVMCHSKKGNELLASADGYDTYTEKDQFVMKCVKRIIRGCEKKNKEEVLCVLGKFKDCQERNTMLQTCMRNPDNRNKVPCNATTKEELQCQIDGFNDCSDKVAMFQKCQKSTKKIPCNATTKVELQCRIDGFTDCKAKENFIKKTTPTPTFPTSRPSPTVPATAPRQVTKPEKSQEPEKDVPKEADCEGEDDCNNSSFHLNVVIHILVLIFIEMYF